MEKSPETLVERLLALVAALGPAALVALLLSALGWRTLPRNVAGLALIMGPVAGLSSLAGGLLKPVVGVLDPPVPSALGEAFLGAAIPEELAKFFVLSTIVLRHHEAERGRDAILAAGWLGLGFAALENFFYVTGSHDWLRVSGMRFATAVPCHVALGLIMGLFLRRAAIERRSSFVWVAIIVPIVLHGFYDWPLLALDQTLSGFSAGNLALIGVFIVTLLVLAGLVCIPVAMGIRTVSGPACGDPGPAGRGIEATARVIAILLQVGSAIAVFSGVIAGVAYDREWLLLVPASILPFAFGRFWQRAAV